MTLPKILIVENNKRAIENYKKAFDGKAELIVWSKSDVFEVGKKAANFDDYRDAKIIIISDGIGSNYINTPPAIAEFRKAGFEGPIIIGANSSRNATDLLFDLLAINGTRLPWLFNSSTSKAEAAVEALKLLDNPAALAKAPLECHSTFNPDTIWPSQFERPSQLGHPA